jgi:predicted DNA-binding transcriptional regulator YafY
MWGNGSRYERLEQVERLLAQRPRGWRTSELARELGVDPDTIRRDLAMLEAMGTGLIKEGWFYRLDHRRAIHTARLTTDEALALYLAARLFSRYSDEHNPHGASALDRLADALHAKSPVLAGHIAVAARTVRSRTTRPEYVATLEVISRAWLERRKVRLGYRSITSDEITERTFAPYYLEPSAIGFACYAIGHDDLRGTLRTLKIERITAARLTDESFAIPDDFDPARLLESAWGVMWGDEDGQAVTLRFPRPLRDG